MRPALPQVLTACTTLFCVGAIGFAAIPWGSGKSEGPGNLSMSDIEAIIQESGSGGRSLLQGAELSEADFTPSTSVKSKPARFESAEPLSAPSAEKEIESSVEQPLAAAPIRELREDTVPSDDFLDFELDDLREAGVSVASPELREQSEFTVAIEAPAELQAPTAGLAIEIEMPEIPISAETVQGSTAETESVAQPEPQSPPEPEMIDEPLALPQIEIELNPTIELEPAVEPEPIIELDPVVELEPIVESAPIAIEKESTPVAVPIDAPIEQPERAPSPLFVIVDGLGRPIAQAKISVQSSQADQKAIALASDAEGLVFADNPPTEACELSVTAKGFEKRSGIAWTSMESAYSPVEIRLKKAKSSSRIIIPRKSSKPKE